MTEPKIALPAPKSNSTPPPAGKPPLANSSGLSGRLALLLALIALVLLGVAALYFWQGQAQQNLRIEHALSQSDEQNQQLSRLQQVTQNKLASLETQERELRSSWNKLTQQIYINTQKLAELGVRSRTDWLLAEAEYLMRMANQRLALEHDIRGAEAMLQSADAIIIEIDDPSLTDIRQTLASELLSLQQVRHLDYQGIYFRLKALIKAVDNLSQQSFLKSTLATQADNTSVAHAPGAPTNRFTELWNTIWTDLKQAVSIRRLDQPLPPLLAPEQHYYLKQNLRLMLEQASLALLDKDSAIFQNSIESASEWLDQYFIQEDPSVQQLQQTLHTLGRQNISQSLPDISTSLRLTKAKIENFYRLHLLNKLSTPESEANTSKANNGAAQ